MSVKNDKLTQSKFIAELSTSCKSGKSTTQFFSTMAEKYGLTFNVISTRYYSLHAKLKAELKGAKTMKVKLLKEFISQLTLTSARGRKKKEDVEGDFYSVLKSVMLKPKKVNKRVINSQVRGFLPAPK